MTYQEKTSPLQELPPEAGWQSPTPLEEQKAFWERFHAGHTVNSYQASDIKPESLSEKTEAKPVSEKSEPIRDAKGRISRRQFLRLGGITLGTAAAVAFTPERVLSQETLKPHEQMFISGTVQIVSSLGLGQAYLVRHEHSYGLYTIEHVIGGRGAATIKITLPGSALRSLNVPETDSPDSVMRIPNVPLADFMPLGAPNGSPDRSAVLEIGGLAAQELDKYGLGNFQRERLPRELKVGSLLGSPRLDTGAWTVYQVMEFVRDQNLIHVQAIYGNHCEGRSGSPMILMNENLSVFIRSSTGNAVVVGEVEGPVEGTPEVPDMEGTGFNCAQFIRVNIAQV